MKAARRPQAIAVSAAGALLLFTAALHAAVPTELRLSKADQRRLGVITQLPAPAAAALLPGRVTADPRQRWRASPDQAGFLEAPEGGFPEPGSRVRAGQVLAWLRPALSDPERRDLQSERTLAERDQTMAQVQIERFKIDTAEAIDVRLPTPSVQIVADWRGAQARGVALDGALSQRVALKAPADGVLLSSLAQAQRVATVGESLFEAATSASLGVELSYSDAGLDAAAAHSAHSIDGRHHTLRLISETFDATLRRHRAFYAVEPEGALSPGEPVELVMPRSASRPSLPDSAVFHREGGDWVWVHEQAERFRAQPVTVRRTEGGELELLSGLAGNERVVVAAAALAKQAAR